MYRKIILISIILLTANCPAAAEVLVKNMRMWHAPDHTQLVFDLSGPVEFKGQLLGGPDRLAVDLSNARLQGVLPTVPHTGQYLKGVRSGQFTPTVLRLVLDLKRKVSPRIAVLPPNQLYGHRLAIDLYGAGEVAAVLSNSPGPSQAAAEPALPKTPAVPVRPQPPPARGPRRSKYFIVAIDAGHGGEDPGAIGRRGTREKEVTLRLAEALKEYIDRDPKMRSVMVRKGDYYISLRRRTAIARRAEADIFVSIHADAFPNRSVRGSSVYALSAKGASSEEARWLADKENAVDLIGGVSLKDKDDLLAYTLYDLSKTKTISDGLELGQDVLAELSRVGTLHRVRVEQAGFVVLKSPDIPSVLVETAFITNPSEEKQLRKSRHRKRIAEAIYKGLKRYMVRKRLPGVAAKSDDDLEVFDATQVSYRVHPGP